MVNIGNGMIKKKLKKKYYTTLFIAHSYSTLRGGYMGGN